jgi:hypothetical protein
MSLRRTLLAFATFVIALPSCGPYLEAQTREAHRYTSPIRCAQGPYEFRATMSGARWGEAVRLVQLSGQPLSGHAEIWIDGEKKSDFEIFPWTPPAPTPTTTTASSPPAPASSSAKPSDACQLSEADRTTPTPGTSAPAPGNPGTPGEGGSTTSTTPGTTITATTPKLVEVPADGSATYSYGHEIAGWSVRVEHGTDTEFPLKAGTEIRIVIWSAKLLDLAGLDLALVHEVYVPSCGDEKWAARLAKEKAESDASAKSRQAESDRCRELAIKNALDEPCRKLGWHDVAESERERVRCEALVPKNAVDEPCRARGYENATLTAERARCQALKKSNQTDEACHKIGLYNDADSARALGGSGPNAPPPPPRAEERPPQPSEHAAWVPGSWEWSASSGASGEWSWIGGGWKVPDVDRQAKATPTAPSQPPAPRAETPGAPPVTGLVWVGGYWHYAGSQWVWVPGRWARPPQSGATWRPNVWVQENGKIRLDPGQWRIGR